jgi:surface protein
MKRKILLKTFALVAAMMCALGVSAAEAYACYTADNTTLTFYYDSQRSSRPGTTYDLNDEERSPDWATTINSSVTQVVFDPSFAYARPISTIFWFYCMTNLSTITGIEYLNTSNVTKMDLMFASCTSLTTLDLSSFNTANVISMESMFGGCMSLTTLNLSSFNTSKVTDMFHMFYNCSSLTSLDLSHFNTSKVSDMKEMFYNCSNLTTIYVDDGWSTAAVTSSDNMFTYCTSLVGGMGTTYDANHVGKAYAHIDGGPSNPGYFTAAGAQPWTPPEAYACYTPSDSTLTFYYDHQRGSRTGTTYDLNTGSNNPGWYTDNTCSSVTHVVFDPSFAGARPNSTIGWFYRMSNLTTITGIEYLNTSEVTNMGLMFYYCKSLTSLDVSNFNTAKVITMDSMFAYCENLTTIYAGDGWNIASLVYWDNMLFYGSTSLVGGMGTTYDANHVDAAYARIDGGPSCPGYFTAAGAQPWTLPEAYACYTADDKTLTFYYDNQRSSREGNYVRTYDLPTGDDLPGWGIDYTNIWVTSVVFDPSFVNVLPTSTKSWFDGMSDLLSITGMQEYLNTSEVTDMRYMFSFCNKLTGLDLSSFNTQNVAHMDSMFYLCSALTSLDLSNFNTSNVTTMNAMFIGCSGLTTLDLSSFNTANVTKMTYLFRYSSGLKTIFAGDGWSTASAPYGLVGMFQGCTSLVGGKGTAYDPNHTDGSYAHIDGGPSNPGYFTAVPEAYACYTADNTTLTFYYDSQRSTRAGTTYDLINTTDAGWYTDGTKENVTKVVFDPSFADARPTSTFDWFCGMRNLQSISDMSYLNTSQVTNMAYMFSTCTGLTTLDLSSFNTSKVTNMYGMFYNCTNLQTVYVGSDWSTVAVMNSNYMFNGCTSLVGGQGTNYSSTNPMDKTYAHIDGGSSNPGYFSEKHLEAYACYTADNTTLTFYCDTQRGTREGATYDLNEGTINPEWRDDGTNASVTRVVFDSSFSNARPTSTFKWFHNMSRLDTITGIAYLNTEAVTTMLSMFDGCSGLTSLDLSHFNTAMVTSMEFMFFNCSGLTSLDLSSFNTSNVTDMHCMFFNCSGLTSLDVSSFNTSNVTDMQGIFGSCSGLSSLDVSGFNTSNVTNMCDMFYSCSGLTSLDVSSFNTSNVTNMIDLFTNCSSLTSLDLSSFNTTSATHMSTMFKGCSSLTSLDLSGFSTANVTNMSKMFQDCGNLTTIYAGDGWSTAAVSTSTNMFLNCTSLVGGMGTTYDANHVDVAYAHIDGGPSNPGYFTAAGQTGGMRGDVDGDQNVNIDDVTALIDYLLGTNSNINLQGADCDESGDISIDDVTTLIDYLLTSHW